MRGLGVAISGADSLQALVITNYLLILRIVAWPRPWSPQMIWWKVKTVGQPGSVVIKFTLHIFGWEIKAKAKKQKVKKARRRK
jgi:hypothetical protein